MQNGEKIKRVEKNFLPSEYHATFAANAAVASRKKKMSCQRCLDSCSNENVAANGFRYDGYIHLNFNADFEQNERMWLSCGVYHKVCMCHWHGSHT